MRLGQKRLPTVVAQREAVGRALGECVKKQLRLHCAARLRHRQRLGERGDGRGEHHVVEELYRLAGARRPAVQDVGAHGAQQRLDAVVEGGVGADHEGEGAGDRRLARAGYRRVGEMRAALGELGGELASQGDRSRTAVDDRLAGARREREFEADGAHLRLTRQGKEDDVRVRSELRDGAHRLDAVDHEALQRLGPQIVGENLAALPAGEVAAHGLAHHAQADETELVHHFARQPPSTTRLWPLIYEASGDARKQTAAAMSSTVPRTPTGMSERTWSSFTATPRLLMSGTPGPRIACE